jgi:hypothetical protein
MRFTLSLFLEVQQLILCKGGNYIKFKDVSQKQRYLHFIFGAIDELSSTVKDKEKQQMWAEITMLAHAKLLYGIDEAILACESYGRTGNEELHSAGEKGYFAMNNFLLAAIGKISKEDFVRNSTMEMYDVVTQYQSICVEKKLC